MKGQCEVCGARPKDHDDEKNFHITDDFTIKHNNQCHCIEHFQKTKKSLFDALEKQCERSRNLLGGSLGMAQIVQKKSCSGTIPDMIVFGKTMKERGHQVQDSINTIVEFIELSEEVMSKVRKGEL